jgi:hypothetical protein
LSFAPATPNEQSRLWGEIGLSFPLNEYRAMWKMGGEPLVERLRDKQHTWTDLQKLIPHITTAGLLGYQFTCPDMMAAVSSVLSAMAASLMRNSSCARPNARP